MASFSEVNGAVSRKNFISFMIQKYGGINNLISSSMRGVNSFKNINNNRVAQSIMRAVSTSIIAYDFFNCIKEFRQYNEDHYEKTRRTACNILGAPEIGDLATYSGKTFALDNMIYEWMFSKPEALNIKGIYSTSGEPIDCRPEESCFIHLTLDKKSCLYYIKSVSYVGNISFVFSNVFTTEYSDAEDIISYIELKYYDSIGWDKNIMVFDNYVLSVRPRCESVGFKVDENAYNRIVSGVSHTMKNGGRRGFMLTGLPGVGKTSVILEIERSVIDYPILHVMANNLRDEDCIRKLCNIIEIFDKIILYFEDIDTLEIGTKTTKLAPILTLLDNSRISSSKVFIATANNLKLIDPAAIRTGRFDDIIMIYPPRSLNKCNELFRTIFKRDIKISLLTYLMLRVTNSTQSDYKEIYDRMCIENTPVSNKNIRKTIREIYSRKKLIK